jgi:hypothetical protein
MRTLKLFCAAALCCFTPVLSAQDAVKVDPTHYSVVSENDRVRILKIHYGPHEKSVMHSHPATVVVFMSDANGKFNFADGKTEEFTTKTGNAQYSKAVTHLPENTGDKPLDGILVELKGAATEKGTKKTIEGCVVKRETHFYIQPLEGNQIKLSAGSQDVQSHEGQNIQASGTIKSSSPAGSTSGGSNKPELLVTSINVVNPQCPANIQKRIDQQTEKTKK